MKKVNDNPLVKYDEVVDQAESPEWVYKRIDGFVKKKLCNHVIKANGDDIVCGKEVTYLYLIISVTS